MPKLKTKEVNIMNAIEVNHLKKYYKTGRNKYVKAVDNITFAVPRGARFGFLEQMK